MDFLQPRSWADALAARAERPDAVPIAGGTDLMVDLNFDRRRPGALLDLGRVAELREWSVGDGAGGGRTVRLGAGVPYARIVDELGDRLPGLAMAARTVGSPQIRVRGTVGGNLGSASPAGDAHPPLLAVGAVIEVESAARGARRIPAADFYTGVKRSALAEDELIAAVLLPEAAGPQQFCKVGTRNAMVIAVSAFACALHPDRKAVGTGIGSAAPTPRRAPEAEEFLAGELDSAGLWDSRGELPETLARAFGERVAAAASPIDDVRGSAAYRRHSLSVMARRSVLWAWTQYQHDLRKAA
ncbi:FAD binding domain-containing protein [Blastococcus tunisiensis]|uniref:CO or xanthine dehydrogenase, FAD-binding subunit n=1 Tax=Blastococcus tunisiensis TaxID=1798228 RepID=A0A1I2GEB1_9ACTN|nr:FAD binding domain-containing protein [Blastococcus sp. DSM 46838]SFF14991.1 CO or xanthine dehydrogenase, FAD-binding subunit [Blastococcus sp. DSM 46838]